MATKSDYDKMATDIKLIYQNADEKDRFYILVNRIIERYEMDNPRFDRERFIREIGFFPLGYQLKK